MENTLSFNHAEEGFHLVMGLTDERHTEIGDAINAAFQKLKAENPKGSGKKSELLQVAIETAKPQNLNEYVFISFALAETLSRLMQRSMPSLADLMSQLTQE